MEGWAQKLVRGVNGGKWTQKWWEVGGWPCKQVGVGRLRPLPNPVQGDHNGEVAIKRGSTVLVIHVLVMLNIGSFHIFSCAKEQSKSGTKTRSSDWIHRGRLDETLLRQELQQLDCERVKMLVCGTKSFNRDMVDSVKRIGLSEKHYFVF